MRVRGTAVLTLGLVIAATGCGTPPTDEPAAADGTAPATSPAQTPEPTVTEPTGTEFDFCGTIDLAAATQVAIDYAASYQLNGQPPVLLTYRKATTAWDPAEEKVTEVSELCHYGPSIGLASLRMQAYPEGREGREMHERATPRPDLGEDAYFRQSGDIFILGAPAGRSFLVLQGDFTSATDPAAAEQALRQLLEPAVGSVPADAVMQRKVADERCSAVEAAASEALGGEVDYSRTVEAGAAFSCTFAALATGAEISIDLRPGLGGELYQGDQTPIGGLENAWRNDSGFTTAVRGSDAITVQLMGAGGSDEDDGNGDYTKDEQLARDVIPVLLP